MSSKTTNFFEIYISPDVEKLYITENQWVKGKESSDNLIVNLTKNSVVSLYPLKGSNATPPKRMYIEWLVKKLLFNAIEEDESAFDVDSKAGEFTLLNDKLAQTNEYSLLWRVKVRIFHAQDAQKRHRLILSLDPITNTDLRNKVRRYKTRLCPNLSN